MPTRPKAAAILESEKKSHRTKTEIDRKKNAEKELATGKPLRERPETAADKIAHAEFLRVNRLLKLVGKNDAIIETVINRYCLLQAECAEYQDMLESFRDQRADLQREYRAGRADCAAGGLAPSEYYKLLAEMQKSIVGLDRQVQAKRKMLFDIERENGMTIAAAMRSIPKKAESESNPLLKALAGDD